MPANFLHAFSAGGTMELHEQMGCMAGIFQVFDRQSLLAGRRFHDQRRLPSSSGHSLSNGSSVQAERLSSSPHIILEKNLSKSSNENQRVSLESSRTSFSSSSCSSFLSLECNGSVQQEPPSIDRVHFPEMRVNNSPKLSSSEVDAHRSMYRVGRNLSVEALKEDKAMDGSHKIGWTPMDLNESYQVPVQFNEESWSSLESIQPPGLTLARNAPRSSYDGREQRPSVTRLSLHSREGLLWSSNLCSRQTPDTNNVIQTSSISQGSATALDARPDQASYKRPPSIIAKLMGLDALPDFSLGREEMIEPVPNISSSDTMKSSVKEPAARQHKNPARAMRSMPKSRHPVETAPWKQQDRTCTPRKTSYGTQEVHIKQPPASVYSEIEKRVELELRQSNRDLRALQQTLALQQDKQISYPISTQIKERDLARAFESPIVIMRPPKSANLSCVSAPSILSLEGSLSDLLQPRTSDPRDKKPPPVSSKMVKDQTAKSSPRVPADKSSDRRSEENGRQKHRSQVIARSSRTQQSVKSSSSTSPRLQQRKIDADRKSHPPIPYTESSKTQRYSVRKNSLDSASPRNRNRRRPSQAQQQDDQSSEKSAGTKSLSHHGDEVSFRSDSNISLVSQMEIEVSSADKSDEMNISFFRQDGRGRSSEKAASVPQKKKSSHCLEEGISSLKPASISPDQPSPVSVLDTSFYQDDQPPPQTKASNAYRDHDSKSSEESGNEFNHKKLENIENLLRKLRQLTSTNDDEGHAIDHIALLCETSNPDHRYVSEILLASGLLMKGLISGQAGSMAFQLHASGYPINPDLFLVLEQRKARENTNRAKPNPEKVYRKLLFDLVNELLIRKSDVQSMTNLPVSNRTPGGQQLLRELCSEIGQLKGKKGRSEDNSNAMSGEDLLQNLEGWAHFGRGMSGIVLDIERSTFKDLIDEVVGGEAEMFLQAKGGRLKRKHCPKK